MIAARGNTAFMVESIAIGRAVTLAAVRRMGGRSRESKVGFSIVIAGEASVRRVGRLGAEFMRLFKDYGALSKIARGWPVRFIKK